MRTAPGPARWRASWWDYLSIVGCLAVLTILGVLVRLVLSPPADPSYPVVVADAVALVLTVLPVWAYFTVAESGPAQATWGKQRAGLRVVGAHGDRPAGRRIAARNAIKLLPWQLAHISVARIILGVDAPVTIWVTYGLSLLIPAVSVAMAWRDPLHRSLHDRVAGTRVVRAGPPSPRRVRPA